MSKQIIEKPWILRRYYTGIRMGFTVLCQITKNRLKVEKILDKKKRRRYYKNRPIVEKETDHEKRRKA